MKPTRRNRQFIALGAGICTLASVTIGSFSPAVAATPKVGGTCAKSQVSRTSGSLVCARTGTKYKWKVAAVSAPVAAATPANSVNAAPTISDVDVQSAIAGAMGAGVTYTKEACTAASLKSIGCTGYVTFEGSAPGETSSITISGMAKSIFEHYLAVNKLVEISGAGLKTWWDADRNWVYFAVTRPNAPERAYYRVVIALSNSVRIEPSPVLGTLQVRLVAVAKAVDGIVSA